MSNIIQDELRNANDKMIKLIDFQGKKLVKLTRNNVAIVEAMIQNDSAYIRSTDINASPKYNRKNKIIYGGSSAYWMTLLKKKLFNEDNGSNPSYENIIKGAVESVDRENSTHLNADKCGRDIITKRICKFDHDELQECLMNPDYRDMKLFREISKKTSEKRGARTNPSFASKFCHYACFYIYEETAYQDNYSIYDGILKTVLPWYLEYYHIQQNYDLNDYKDYRSAIDKIRDESGVEISRNGFDHLLWYYHKGRL